LINQHIFKVVPLSEIPDWLIFAQIEYQMPWFLGLAADKATTLGHIQRAHLDERVPMPAVDRIREASRTIEPLWDAQLSLTLEVGALERARDELLPLLLSGRLVVDKRITL
jgi:type I restriction enzyme S subunit